MAAARKLTLTILGNSKGAQQAFQQAGAAGESFGSRMGSIGKKAGLALSAAAAGAAYMGMKLIKAAEESAVADARLAQVNKSMGLFGKQTQQVTDRLIKYAQTTSMQVGVDDEVIKATQAKLLTFKELTKTADKVGGSFDRATMAAIDMAATGFGTAEGNAVQLGKALNDPVKGVTALSRSGITFTKQEKAKLKALAESGRMLEAQDFMLKAIEKQVGGTAKATATASERMGIAFGEIQEGLGTLLLPAFEGLTNFVVNKVVPAFDKLTEVGKKEGISGVFKLAYDNTMKAAPKLIEGARNTITRMVEWVQTDGVALLRTGLSKLGELFTTWIEPNIMPALGKLGDFILQVAGWMINEGQPKLIAALKDMGGGLVGWIIEAVPKLREKLQEFVRKLGGFIKENLPQFVENLKVMGSALVDWIGEAIRKLPKELVKLAATIVEVLATDVIPTVLKAAPGILKALLSWVGSLAVDLIAGVGAAFVELIKSLPRMAVALAKGLGDLAAAAGKSLTNGLISMINKLIQKVNDLLEFTIPVPMAPDIHIDAPDIPLIPKLAEGGIVTRPTLSVVGEAGAEAVIPLSKLDLPQGGGDTYHITVQTGVGDPAAIGKSVVDALQAYQRRAGALPLKVA